MRQPPLPSGSARVVMRPVSVPASGSVTPNATWRSPAAARGRNVSFSRSLPNFTTGLSPNTVRCTAEQPFIAAPLARDLVEHHRGVGDAAAAAAVLLGDGETEPAALGQAGVEVPRELVLAVAPGPVVVVEPGAQLADRVGDQDLVVVEELVGWAHGGSLPPR